MRNCAKQVAWAGVLEHGRALRSTTRALGHGLNSLANFHTENERAYIFRLKISRKCYSTTKNSPTKQNTSKHTKERQQIKEKGSTIIKTRKYVAECKLQSNLRHMKICHILDVANFCYTFKIFDKFYDAK